MQELAEELHKPVRRKFERRRVRVNGIDEIWAADLIDMQVFSKFNKGVKYLLSVIDIFSKYGWLIPLKDKTGKSVAAALKKIIQKGRKPTKMWVDKGTEFYNKEVQRLVELYSIENEEKSSVVERWNRTMKEKMWKYFSAKSTNVYIDVLHELVDQYNTTWHSTIKMTPVDASKKKNENTVWRNLYPDHDKVRVIDAKFSVGDKVRINKKKKTFEKGYTPRWTEEVFTISAVQNTSPVTYKITDYNNEEIKGTFYEPELQKTSQEIYRIEKVIKKGRTKSLVKWKGYPETFNSWISNKELIALKK
jgi:transposase InsO family protein